MQPMTNWKKRLVKGTCWIVICNELGQEGEIP